MQIAFFDFDGTITNKDSFIEFIKFAVGNKKFIKGFVFLSPVLVLYKLKLIPNDIAKQKVISYFFQGYEESDFKVIAKEFSLKIIDKIVKNEMLERIKWHKSQGHKVVIVSASMECWLKPWCEKYDLDIIATKLEFKNGFVTGKFLTKNCFGIEKVRCIKEIYNLEKFDYIYAYGDSKGDKYMLALADEGFYINKFKLNFKKGNII
jgi:phosphatidylglycerophosphatase C